MTPLDKLKLWAKTLNFDPKWQAEVDAQTSIDDLESMVCSLTAEIGYLNLQYLSQLV